MNIAFINVLLSGTFASLGGLFGKLSGEHFFNHSWANYATHLTCLALMVIFNGAMWTLFVRALQNNSSFKATVISSAVNFFLSGLFAIFIFGEATGWLWWTGICCVLFGLILIQTSDDKAKEN